jgi:hypothetical protein
MANDRNGVPISPGTSYVLIGPALKDNGATTLLSIGGTIVSATTNELAQVGSFGGGGGVSDGNKGDITVSSSGTVWTVNSGAVSAAEVTGLGTAATQNTFGAGDPLGALSALALFPVLDAYGQVPMAHLYLRLLSAMSLA